MGLAMSYQYDSRSVAALSPPHVAGYLRSRGWTDEGKFGPFGQLYAIHRGGRDEQIVLPRLATIGDFVRRMAEVLETLARVEDRSPSQVLFDLTLAPFDVIRVRSKDADDYGSVPLDAGLRLHEETRRAVAAAALAEAAKKPRRAWKGGRPDSVVQYMGHVRLGQTENRSFSLTVLSPYSFDPTDQPDFFEHAFGRRVTLKFGTALMAIQGALAEAVASDPLSAFEKTLDAGVSADMCHALAKLADSDAGVEISVGWSPAKPVQEPVSIGLTRQDAAVLDEVARTFSRQEPEPDCTIEGLIRQINVKLDSFDGSVIFEAHLPNQSGLKKVKVDFEERHRERVFRAAHEKKWARITGELRRDGRVLTLLEPRDFMIVEPDDEV